MVRPSTPASRSAACSARDEAVEGRRRRRATSRRTRPRRRRRRPRAPLIEVTGAHRKNRSAGYYRRRSTVAASEPPMHAEAQSSTTVRAGNVAEKPRGDYGGHLAGRDVGALLAIVGSTARRSQRDLARESSAPRHHGSSREAASPCARRRRHRRSIGEDVTARDASRATRARSIDTLDCSSAATIRPTTIQRERRGTFATSSSSGAAAGMSVIARWNGPVNAAAASRRRRGADEAASPPRADEVAHARAARSHGASSARCRSINDGPATSSNTSVRDERGAGGVERDDRCREPPISEEALRAVARHPKAPARELEPRGPLRGYEGRRADDAARADLESDGERMGRRRRRVIGVCFRRRRAATVGRRGAPAGRTRARVMGTFQGSRRSRRCRESGNRCEGN